MYEKQNKVYEFDVLQSVMSQSVVFSVLVYTLGTRGPEGPEVLT